MSSGLLQVFVELGNLHGTSNYVLPSPCVVPKCKENYKNGPNVHCFSFPKSKHLFDKWKHAIKRVNFTPSPCSKECELHFRPEGGHIGRNVVEITIKMKTIVQKSLMVKIIKIRLRNLDYKHLKKTGGHIGIRTKDPRGFNKGRSSKFREGSRVRQTPEEGRRTYRPKRCGNNNKDKDNSPKTLNYLSWGWPEGSLFSSYYSNV